MKVEEEPLTKPKLIRRSLTFLIIGAIFLISGFAFDIAGLRGLGNLAILTAILLWFYKYILSRAVDYFQYKSLSGIPSKWKRPMVLLENTTSTTASFLEVLLET